MSVAAQLPGKSIVRVITGAAQIVVFDDKQHVPVEYGPHEPDQPRRHVRVDVYARMFP
jgi:hypothetical protein